MGGRCQVNDTLSARRENIEELNGVRTLLKKLQVVFDLPQKLRVCIEQDALALAVKYYTGTSFAERDQHASGIAFVSFCNVVVMARSDLVKRQRALPPGVVLSSRDGDGIYCINASQRAQFVCKKQNTQMICKPAVG